MLTGRNGEASHRDFPLSSQHVSQDDDFHLPLCVLLFGSRWLQREPATVRLQLVLAGPK